MAAGGPREDCVLRRRGGPTRRGKLVLGAFVCAAARYFGASWSIVAGAGAYTLYWALFRRDGGAVELVEGDEAAEIVAGAAGDYRDARERKKKRR